jgi:hypothetical protein
MDFNSAIKGGLSAITITERLYRQSENKSPALATHLTLYSTLLVDYTQCLREKFNDLFNIRMDLNEQKELEIALKGISKNLTKMNAKVKNENPELYNYTPFTVYLQVVARSIGLALKQPPSRSEGEEHKGEEAKNVAL